MMNSGYRISRGRTRINHLINRSSGLEHQNGDNEDDCDLSESMIINSSPKIDMHKNKVYNMHCKKPIHESSAQTTANTSKV